MSGVLDLWNNARAKASALFLLTPNECSFYDLFLSFIIQISIQKGHLILFRLYNLINKVKYVDKNPRWVLHTNNG